MVLGGVRILMIGIVSKITTGLDPTINNYNDNSKIVSEKSKSKKLCFSTEIKSNVLLTVMFVIVGLMTMFHIILCG